MHQPGCQQLNENSPMPSSNQRKPKYHAIMHSYEKIPNNILKSVYLLVSVFETAVCVWGWGGACVLMSAGAGADNQKPEEDASLILSTRCFIALLP